MNITRSIDINDPKTWEGNESISTDVKVTIPSENRKKTHNAQLEISKGNLKLTLEDSRNFSYDLTKLGRIKVQMAEIYFKTEDGAKFMLSLATDSKDDHQLGFESTRIKKILVKNNGTVSTVARPLILAGLFVLFIVLLPFSRIVAIAVIAAWLYYFFKK